MFENSLKPVNPSESGGAPTPSVTVASPGASHAGGGKVIYDSRGNAVWDWAVATGVLARSKSAELLSMLDNPTLALEGECEFGPEWTGDPYNRR
ncbi:MAG: hypothetical protein ACRETD_11775 [Steroidobacteraceae bacterium]